MAKIKPPKKRCKSCHHWQSRICHNKHIRIGDALEGDACEGCKKDAWVTCDGIDAGKDVEDMDRIINEIMKFMFLRTEKNFCCVHWKSKYEGIS